MAYIPFCITGTHTSDESAILPVSLYYNDNNYLCKAEVSDCDLPMVTNVRTESGQSLSPDLSPTESSSSAEEEARTKRKNKRKHVKIQCEFCQESFHLTIAFTKQLQGSGSLSCSVCGKSFTSKRYLWQHKKTHSGSHRFPCDVCDRVLASKQSLIRHMKSHKQRVKSYSCHICGEKFYAKSLLKYHEKLQHNGKKRFKCSICDKKTQ